MYNVEKAAKTEEQTAQQLPKPKGYKILIAMPEVNDSTDSGLVVMTNAMKEKEEVASIVGFVMKMGDTAYGDKTKFPTGPYCKEGDFIIFRSYSGTRFKIHGKEFRLINDDTVEAVVDDPRGYERV